MPWLPTVMPLEISPDYLAGLEGAVQLHYQACNILTGNDPVNGNWSYTYDDFARLSSSSKSGQAFNYKYDRFGNRWQQNVTAGSGPAPQYSFAPTTTFTAA